MGKSLWAKLKGGDFYCANLFFANLVGAEVKGEPSNCGKNRPVLFANFRGIFADLADFTDAKLDNGNFDEAKMSKAKFE